MKMQVNLTKKQMIYILAGVVAFLILLLVLWVSTGSGTVPTIVGTGAAVAAAEAARQRQKTANEITQTVSDANQEAKKVVDTLNQVDVQSIQVRKEVRDASDDDLKKEATRLFAPKKKRG